MSRDGLGAALALVGVVVMAWDLIHIDGSVAVFSLGVVLFAVGVFVLLVSAASRDLEDPVEGVGRR